MGHYVWRIFIAILVSETSSNTASANMVVPVMIALAVAANVSPIPPAIRSDIRRECGVGLHAPGINPAQCDRLRFGNDPDYEDDQSGHLFDILGGLIIGWG